MVTRSWVTVISGRGDKADSRVKSILATLREEYGPITKLKLGRYGSYSQPGGAMVTYKGKKGIVISHSYDRAGFSGVDILSGSIPDSELKSLVKELRSSVGIKSPYRYKPVDMGGG